MKKKKKGIQISDKVWLLISLLAALLLWYCLSLGAKTGRSFPFIDKVVPAVGTMIQRGAFWKDIKSSLGCVALGFILGFATALPIAFLMAWYTPVQKIIEPWINFIRNIPALGYAPLIVIIFGVGQKPAVILIWICTFMTMSITIYQGIKNIDTTLIKAARVLGLPYPGGKPMDELARQSQRALHHHRRPPGPFRRPDHPAGCRIHRRSGRYRYADPVSGKLV